MAAKQIKGTLVLSGLPNPEELRPSDPANYALEVTVSITEGLLARIAKMLAQTADIAFVAAIDNSIKWDEQFIHNDRPLHVESPMLYVSSDGDFWWTGKCMGGVIETHKFDQSYLAGTGIKANYIALLEPLVELNVHVNQEDFEKYDKKLLENYNGEFVWAVRPTGTDMLCLCEDTFDHGKVVQAMLDTNLEESKFHDILWKNPCAIFTFRENNTRFYHGRNGTVTEIKRADAISVVGGYFNKLLNDDTLRAEAVKARMNV
jgi:beta-galactosidase/beta-glucuronidase